MALKLAVTTNGSPLDAKEEDTAPRVRDASRTRTTRPFPAGPATRL
jgi:hypothetical protein